MPLEELRLAVLKIQILNDPLVGFTKTVCLHGRRVLSKRVWTAASVASRPPGSKSQKANRD
jgi:hypothetical protein